MRKLYIIPLLLATLVGLWLLLPSSDSNTDSSSASEKSSEQLVVSENDLIIGTASAPATIIEYADFKCPSCGQFHQTTSKELRAEYGDTNKLKIVFRPMAVIGPDSERAAIGAYCAHDQGKFTEFHDAVYDYMWNNYYRSRDYSAEFKDVLTTGVLSDIANKIGLEGLSFSSCLNGDAKSSLVSKNQSLANQAGVRGTPTFSINGQLIVGPQPTSAFKKLIEIQL